MVLDLAREERTALVELAQDVAAKRAVLLQPRRSRCGSAAAASALAGAAGPRRDRGRRATRRASAPARAAGRARRCRTRRAGSRGRGAAVARRVEIGSSWRKPSRRTVSSTPLAVHVEALRRGSAMRRASSTPTSRMPHLLEAEHAREPQPPPARASRRRFRARCGSGWKRRTRSTPSARSALRSARPDDPVAGEQRQHVVAVGSLVLALVDLDHVPEAEQALEQRPVPDQVVEGAEEDGRRGVAVELRVGVDVERRASVFRLRPRAAAPRRRARGRGGGGVRGRP